MYVSENKKVMELAKVLEDKGMLSEYVDDAVVCYDDMVYFEKCCDNDTLDACIEAISRLQDEQDVWRWLYTTELLKCEPQVLGRSLVYGFWRYLHWFGGSCYQVSFTQDGHITRAASHTRMDWILMNVRSPEAKHLILTTALLTTALRFYKRTKQLLSTDAGVAMLEDFILQDFHKHYAHDDTFGLQNLFQYISESRGRRPSPYNTGEGALMVQLGDKVTCAGFGVLVLSKEKISVTTMEEQEYVTREFTFPDWVTAKTEDGTPTLNTFGEEVYEATVSLFVEFLLYYSGLRVSVTGVYSVMGRKNTVMADRGTLAATRDAVFRAVHTYYSA